MVAPLRVCHSTWPKEIEKWSDFEHLKIVVLHGPDKDKLLKEEADIYAINPEGLSWLLGVEKSKTPTGRLRAAINLQRWNKLGFDTLLVDELSKFKNTNTLRFKSLKPVLGTFKRRWGLTGTPAASGLMGLFGQCYVLDEGKALGRYITHYRNLYFDKDFDGFTYTLKPNAEFEIYNAVKPLALRMGDDLVDMPELIKNNIEVELPDGAFKVYREIEKSLFTEIENGTVTAANTASAIGKCKQVANGGIYLDPDVKALLRLPTSHKKSAEIHSEKLDALESLIEELQGSPVLVFYEFKHDLKRIKDRFGDVPVIGGGSSTEKTLDLENQWNAGKLPYLFAHPDTVAFGLNLQESGSQIVWFSLTWKYEIYDQCIRRIYRQGAKSKTVVVHHIIAKNTIDEVILSVLEGRKTGQQKLFDALKQKNRV